MFGSTFFTGQLMHAFLAPLAILQSEAAAVMAQGLRHANRFSLARAHLGLDDSSLALVYGIHLSFGLFKDTWEYFRVHYREVWG